MVTESKKYFDRKLWTEKKRKDELKPSSTSGAASGADLQAQTVRKKADLRKARCAGFEVPGFSRKADPRCFK